MKRIYIVICLVFIFACADDQGTYQGKWAEYEIIDIHAHIGYYKGYDLSMNTLMDNINRYGIKTALISNADGSAIPGYTLDLDEKEINIAAADSVRAFPDQLRAILWARPDKGDPEIIENFLKDPQFKDIFVAVKLHPDFNNFPADDPAVDPYLNLCEKYGIPAVFHSGGEGDNSDPEKILNLAKRHPDVPIVLYHTGFLGPHDRAIDLIKTAVENNEANLYAGTGQMSVEGVLKAVEELGAGRVMFGTDAVYYGKEHYKEYEIMINTLKTELSEEDFFKIVSDNAKRVFKLK